MVIHRGSIQPGENGFTLPTRWPSAIVAVASSRPFAGRALATSIPGSTLGELTGCQVQASDWLGRHCNSSGDASEQPAGGEIPAAAADPLANGGFGDLGWRAAVAGALGRVA